MGRAANVFMMSIALSWAGVASAQVAAVKGESQTATAIGVLGTHSATGGFAPAVQGTTMSTDNSGAGVVGENLGTSGFGSGVIGFHVGDGKGVWGRSNSGIGVLGSSSGQAGVWGEALSIGGVGVYGQGGAGASSVAVIGHMEGLGRAGRFDIVNGSNSNEAVFGTTNGKGRAGVFRIANATSGEVALTGETNGDGIGVQGIHSATTGTDPGVRGETSSTDSGAAGVVGANLGTAGTGIGVLGFHGGDGKGVLGQSVSGLGVEGISNYVGVWGETPSGVAVWGNAHGSGFGVKAENSGTGAALYASQSGPSGSIAIFASGGLNKARIDKDGVGYFNGGTVNSGADLAETFDVEDDRDDYEPGDVLAISTRSDRTLEKSSAPNSTLVAGVYATKPGVLLTDLDIEATASRRVPLGMVGVIPTKVSAEQGAIRRGDLLVTAATRGHAMKAGAAPAVGTVLGKALQDFAGPGTGVVNVLVNVK